MAGDDQTAMLREAAKARGFKLVKSRRRKKGGDFGKYGLTDAKGRECFGFGAKGLTGDAEGVLAFLRGGETASWKRSLMGVVGGKETSGAKGKSKAASAKTSKPARLERSRETSGSAKAAPIKPQRKRLSTALETSGAVEHQDAPLSIRSATAKDAKAIAKLLGTEAAALKKRLGMLAKADIAPLLAIRDEPVGVIAWARVPSLDQPPVVRITTLFVAEEARREGIGTALLEATAKHFKKSEALELLLDISLSAPTGFLRKTGWRRSANAYRQDRE